MSNDIAIQLTRCFAELSSDWRENRQRGECRTKSYICLLWCRQVRVPGRHRVLCIAASGWTDSAADHDPCVGRARRKYRVFQGQACPTVRIHVLQATRLSCREWKQPSRPAYIFDPLMCCRIRPVSIHSCEDLVHMPTWLRELQGLDQQEVDTAAEAQTKYPPASLAGGEWGTSALDGCTSAAQDQLHGRLSTLTVGLRETVATEASIASLQACVTCWVPVAKMCQTIVLHPDFACLGQGAFGAVRSSLQPPDSAAA